MDPMKLYLYALNTDDCLCGTDFETNEISK